MRTHPLTAVAVVLGILLMSSPALAGGAVPPPPFPTRGPEPETGALTGPTVTLTFDDGTDDHYAIARLLEKNDLRGVFYVNSGRLDTDDYLTTGQVRAMQRHGQEIGGHTVFHLRLSQQDRAEQQRQICVDRNQLLASGIEATDFAYPFNDFTSATADIVRACGYASARTTDGVGCSSCADYETLPAEDPFRMRAMSGFTPDTTAADLIAAVNRVPGEGGWLQLVFHRICASSCDENSMRLSEFTRFVRWLSFRRSTGLVRSATVRQLLGTRVAARVTAPGPTATHLTFQNRSIEEDGPDRDGPPRCFSYGSASSHYATWRTTSASRTGRTAIRADVRRAIGNVRLYTTQDLGSCAPAVRAGRSYRIGVYYRSTKPIKTGTYLRQSNGGYEFFGSTATFPASATWRLASWVVGPIPARSGRALSAAVLPTAAGTYTFDDFAILPAASGPGATVAAAAAPGRGVAGQPAREPKKAGPGATPSPPGAAFVPPGGGPPLADGGSGRVTSRLAAQSGWLGWTEIGGTMLTVLAVLILLDRRFRYLHRRTRKP